MARPAGSSNNQLYKWAQKVAGVFLTAPVANASLADMTQATIKGRASGAGTGPPTDLTGTQTTAILDVFTSALKGLVPNSGGGTANILRADGAFAAPPAFTAATQAEQEAGSSLTVGVTPGRQQFHPSAVKAWTKWNNASTINASYNTSSITDNGASDWTVNFSTAFSSVNYGVGLCVIRSDADSYLNMVAAGGQAAGSCRVNNVNGGGGQEPASNFLMATGDQ